MDGREGGDAEVVFLPGDLHPGAAILRKATLRDVELRHDLHARHHGGVDGFRLDRGLAQEAVHAVADPEILLVRLEVEVGSALAHRLVHHRVHEADDRAVLLGADDCVAPNA